MRIVASVLSWLVLAQSSAQTPEGAPNLELARYTTGGELRFPDGVDRWVHLGSGIGHGYAEDNTFDAGDPGTIHVVHIEPEAYRHLLEHKSFADGTMLLLSFYLPQAAPEPELNGFMQGELAAREIHVIDRSRFADGRAFFLYDPAAASTPMIPAGNECVVCHEEHGRFDGTFTQFYPFVRELLPTD
jgi:hypothetical protein